MVNVIVKRDPKATQQKGDWTVKKGRGRGGTNISSHRLKSEAVKRGRSAARGSAEKGDGQGVTLWVQDKEGRPEVESEYNGGHEGGQRGGLFGIF